MFIHQLLLGNTNRNSVVIRTLSPRIEARYVRINPQYWNGWICMRTELYGCSSNEGTCMKLCYTTDMLMNECVPSYIVSCSRFQRCSSARTRMNRRPARESRRTCLLERLLGCNIELKITFIVHLKLLYLHLK